MPLYFLRCNPLGGVDSLYSAFWLIALGTHSLSHPDIFLQLFYLVYQPLHILYVCVLCVYLIPFLKGFFSGLWIHC